MASVQRTAVRSPPRPFSFGNSDQSNSSLHISVAAIDCTISAGAALESTPPIAPTVTIDRGQRPPSSHSYGLPRTNSIIVYIRRICYHPRHYNTFNRNGMSIVHIPTHSQSQFTSLGDP